MEKGKYGIYLWFYAVIAFILAFLGQTLLGGLLLGFVILVEKNDWLTRQVMQAFLLSLCSSVIQMTLGWIRNAQVGLGFANIDRIDVSRHEFLFGLSGFANGLGNIINGYFVFISTLISLTILILCIMGIVKVVKGQDANIPGIYQLANKAFGVVEKKVYTNVNQPNDQVSPEQPPVKKSTIL